MISNFKFQISNFEIIRFLSGAALAVTLFTTAAYETAFGLDPRHNSPISCDSCHVAHNSLGGGMTNADSNANLCLSCHISTGMAAKKSFIDSMKATPGSIGTSHKWDVPVSNLDRGASYPTNPEMVSRLDPIVKGRLTEDSLDKTSAKNLLTSYFENQYKDKIIQFYSFPTQASGKASGGSTVSMEDSTMNWSTNKWAEYYLYITMGANAGQSRKISGNTSKVLTVEAFDAAIAAGDTYTIYGPSYANSGTAKKVTSNTADSIYFESFPVTPRKDDKYAIMGSGKTQYEQSLINSGKIREKDVLITKFSCSTCHNQHLQQAKPWNPFSDSTYVPYTPGMPDPTIASNNRKFLRVNNDRSQLCLECHRARSTSTAMDSRLWHEGEMKSHPVNKIFVTDADTNLKPDSDLKKPLGFNSKPLDASLKAQVGTDSSDKRYELNKTGGNTNQTANLMLDPYGRLQCMSCHNVHFTDSDENTEDKP